MKRLALLTLALIVLLTTAPAAQSSLRYLQHLGGVEEVKNWFNACQGHPRLIFLLSPT